MTTIRCLATGSSGNCYLVNLGSGYFLLDCGVTLSVITKAINLNGIDFCFVSHKHKDHSFLLETLARRGVKIFAPKVIQETNKNALLALFGGKYEVFTFDVQHGECPNSGIIIKDKTSNECLLYATDFNLCYADLSDFAFTRIIVECNYLEDRLKGRELDFKEQRQINTHMGLEGLQIFLDSLKLYSCKEIILCHMSQGLGDRVIMGATIYARYRIKTGVCCKLGGIDYYG